MSDDRKLLKSIVEAATCIILDVEGTTTSVDFVRKDLFSYRDQHLKEYVKSNWETSEVQDVVKELCPLGKNHPKSSLEPMNLNSENILDKNDFQDAVINHLQDQFRKGKSSQSVKALEGSIFKNGFVSSNLKGHVYSDVPSALRHWKIYNKKVFIYSNGSVEAQRLLFKFSMQGDIEQYIDGNFDTTIGSKLDPISYSKICEATKTLPAETVFISDNPQELFAASQSGLHIVLIVRNPDNPLFLQDENFPISTEYTINSFSDVY